MKTEMIGNAYTYMIDTSYGINQDGFIAIGTESIVYKGLKTNQDGDLQFSCVLKFKPKTMIQNGKIIDRLAQFKNVEWKIFNDLKDCRSVVRIDDVIEDLGDFRLPCDKIANGVINKAAYFCVIEEFVDGWSLEEYCKEEYWKLRKIVPIGNGLCNLVNFHAFSVEEKKAVQQSYVYDNILKYQNQMLLFMINLCEILEYVTEQKNILHLDIKPDNIMVTRYGKELVLIDFGRSKKVTKANRFAKSDLTTADYSKDETLDQMYQYGTLGYAAPECYAKAENRSSFPFSSHINGGNMSIESDIFSFGATFWECFHIFELTTKNKIFANEAHDFYREYFLDDTLYFNRDFSCISLHYHEKIERIIKKCTKRRNDYYTDTDNKDYYHSYKDLKKDIEDAQDSLPTIVKEENVKAKNAFRVSGGMLALCTLCFIIYILYRFMAFGIAESKWENLVAAYNDTQFYKMEEIARDMVTTSPGDTNRIYAKIASFTYADHGDISEYEAALLVELCQQTNNKNLLPERVDEIMCNANSKKFKEISNEIIKLDVMEGSIGYELARAINNVEVGKTEIPAAYEVLMQYQDQTAFHNAIVKLKNVLDNDEYINIIANDNGMTRIEVKESLKKIVVKEMQS